MHFVRKISIASALALAIVATACTTQTKQNETNNANLFTTPSPSLVILGSIKTYANKDPFFKMEYPSGWTAKQEQPKQTNFYAVRFSKNTSYVLLNWDVPNSLASCDSQKLIPLQTASGTTQLCDVTAATESIHYKSIAEQNSKSRLAEYQFEIVIKQQDKDLKDQALKIAQSFKLSK